MISQEFNEALSNVVDMMMLLGNMTGEGVKPIPVTVGEQKFNLTLVPVEEPEGE